MFGAYLILQALLNSLRGLVADEGIVGHPQSIWIGMDTEAGDFSIAFENPAQTVFRCIVTYVANEHLQLIVGRAAALKWKKRK